jgi:hypothetical protein
MIMRSKVLIIKEFILRAARPHNIATTCFAPGAGAVLAQTFELTRNIIQDREFRSQRAAYAADTVGLSTAEMAQAKRSR